MKYQDKMRHFCCVGVVFLLSLSLVSCSQMKQTNWNLIVPDNYQGVLGIRYNCVDGPPLSAINGTITVAFKDDGSFCTSSSFTPTIGSDQAQSRGGQSIQVVPSPWDAQGNARQGYGLYGGNTREIGENTLRNPSKNVITISLYWVGDLTYAFNNRGAASFPDSEDDFLESRFGIPKNP